MDEQEAEVTGRIRPKNWTRFQHYRHRRPPWIKLHRDLLDDFEYHCLPLASKALAPLLWLMASEENDGWIDCTAQKISFRFRITKKQVTDALSPLIRSGFFECEQVASNTLADCKQNVTTEKRRVETETEAECGAPSADSIPQDSGLNGHKINFDGVNFQGITEAQELQWQDAYPAVPIPPAIAQAAAWLKANPANRKSNCERFLVNWFKRDQDKAGRVKR